MVDEVIEASASRVMTVKRVRAEEEYLRDHFPGFPVLPGVLMLESMVQAARVWLERGGGRHDGGAWVLGKVQAMKFGTFLRPGWSLRVTVVPGSMGEDGMEFRGEARAEDPSGRVDEGAVAASGRFTMRAARVEWAGGTATGTLASVSGGS